MKLVMITVVEEYHDEVLNLLKEANIERFSESSIEGHKKQNPAMTTMGWFSGEKSGVRSNLFFSFTEDKNVEVLFPLVEKFNEELVSNNPIRVAVLPIEKFI